MEQTDLFTGLVLGWLSAACVLFLYWAGRVWWKRRKFGIAVDHGLLLVTFGHEIANAPDSETLSRLLTEDLPRDFGVKRSVLLLPDEYQLVSKRAEDLCLPINHAAVRWVTSSGEAQLSDRGRMKELILQGRAELSWTRVWAPLMRGTRLEGMWLIGERETGVKYSPEDLQWFTSIAREAAAVLETQNFARQERNAAAEIRTLYRQVVAARETERGRLARELHDGVLQDLCAMSRDLKALQKQAQSGGGVQDSLVDLSSDTVHALRAICNDLRPPLLVQDLTTALEALIEDMDGRSSAPVHIEISIQENALKLPDDVALAFFRITQEALNNALQHADASEIAVRLTEYPDRLRLTITDDGQGIPGNLNSSGFVAKGHYGIAGMRERAEMIGGKLDVQTSIGFGTVVILEFPF
jgi:signal transduction histidine kinase